MGYEKKYKEALERARKLQENSNGMILKKWLWNIFPELAESEDEKTRKALISFLKSPFVNENITDEKVAPWLAWLEKQGEPQDKGEISDGYHTFNELYYYRMLYNAAFFNMLPKEWVHKSKKHNDGEECFGGGWFIVMANLPTGQVSNHYELKDWDLFQIPEKEVADEWDGHTPQEAADRLHKYLLEKQGESYTKRDVDDVYVEGMAFAKDELEKQSKEDSSIQQAYEWGYTEGKRIERKHWVEKQNFSEDYNSIDPQFGKPIEQKPTEWSKEDEKMIGRIRSIIEAYAFSQSAVDVNGDLCKKEYIDADNWLKSLKDRYTWKPSDEQITVLELASKYERVFTPKQIDILIGLKEQLKKLKE